MKQLDYAEWRIENEEDLDIQFAETGLDREPGFDAEKEIERRYEKYLLSFKDCNTCKHYRLFVNEIGRLARCAIFEKGLNSFYKNPACSHYKEEYAK